jgi:hypothetical protein
MTISPRWSLRTRFGQLLLIAIVLSTILVGELAWLYASTSDGSSIREWHFHIPFLSGGKNPADTTSSPPGRLNHPIDDLIRNATREYEELLLKQTRQVDAGAKAYEERRGRRPPPGFDVWYKFAEEHDAVMVEDFFDRIYHDLSPFWAMPPKDIRQQANDFPHTVSVRNGETTKKTDHDRAWMDLWEDLVKSIAPHLPDIDIAINVMDESRIVVPWEVINEYMKVERRIRRIVPAKEVVSEYKNTVVMIGEHVPEFDPEWIHHGPYWDITVAGCAPDSPARNYIAETDYTHPPPLPTTYPNASYHGYVSNWTLTKSPCDNPTLQALHGTFVEPISLSTSKKLIPLFGGSKLPMNNAILLPPAMYWAKDPMYSGGEEHGGPWEEKQNKIIWRGVASGGRNRKENWTRFQRHRFVAMVNATTVSLAEKSNIAPNFKLPEKGLYNLTAPSLGKWVGEFADAAFVALLCFPDERPPYCDYTDPWFSVAKPIEMKEQYSYKYLPDIDGNSFSGRYRGFLDSTSLPLKATIYDEWHDSRLVPWVHFVPMDNTFVDFYGIMEYFLGRLPAKEGHDDVAKTIALAGKSWGEKVLRREDMQIYVFRLLLEYARLCDDNRDKLGWVSPSEK